MNNIENILQYVDDLISQETESNLTPVQEAILTGVWQKKGYSQIAKEFHCSESHIKKEAAKLWKKLGQALEEDINKDNFRSKIEKKYRVSQGYNFGYCVQVNEGNINICEKDLQTTKYRQKRLHHPKTENQLPIIDLTKAPELNCNYGRNSEIVTIKGWIKNKNKLITIYGLIGIGKTALILKLIPEIQTEFDYIIYRSLDYLPKLVDLKDELKHFFSQCQSNPLSEIIDYFRSSRCLVILDDVQNIFKRGNLAGQYLPEYKDYSKFFNQMATLSHQSCLILISWENLPEIETLEGENKYTKTLPLQGLGEDAKEILRQKGLKDEEKWDELITLYQSHPTWLNIIALAIKKLFNGRVDLFLKDEYELFLGDIETILESHLERLSELEKKVIKWLANQKQSLDIDQKPTDWEISQAKFSTVMQSLTRRSLIDKVSQEEAVKFQVNSVFKAYIKNM